MSKLMTVLGIILLAAGIAIAVVGLVNQAPLLVYNISLPTAIELVIGGVLALGLGGVIDAVNRIGTDPAVQSAEDQGLVVEVPAASAEMAKPSAEDAVSKPMRFPSFSRKVDDTASAGTSALAQETVMTPAVKETISALEQAKTDLEAAMGSTEEPAAHAEGELYVVEDKVVRGRPARILSDGTVEAETEEGWMRFENLEHLDEYLDAVEQA